MEDYLYQVSVIIVNYNTLEMTHRCIDTIFNNTYDVTFEVILIDNCSRDGSRDFFEKDERIKYIYSCENMGFGRANNVGLMLSRGEYLFLLNSDTLLVNNAIKLFYNYAKSHDHDSFNFYGTWLLDKNLHVGLSFGDEPTIQSLLRRTFDSYLLNLNLISRDENVHGDHPSYGKDSEVGYVSGADMFFNRSIYEKYGAFDHNFFMYLEEAEWQKRVKSYGVKSYVIEGPQIIHLHGGSDKNKKDGYHASINTLIMMKRSRKYFVKKYYNFSQYLFYLIISFLFDNPIILFSRHYSFKDKVKYVCG